MVKRLLQRAFFGKQNCLKLTLTDKHECYMEFGVEKKEKEWSWKPVKFNDMELGQILAVLEGRMPSVSFFHDFKGEKTQVWVSKKGDAFFIKVKELSKSLAKGEQEVLAVILRHCIVRMNILV